MNFRSNRSVAWCALACLLALALMVPILPVGAQQTPTGGDMPTIELPTTSEGPGAETSKPDISSTDVPSAPAPRGERATVQSVRSSSTGARSSGSATFDPNNWKPIEWGEVPDEGQKLTIDSADAPQPVLGLVDDISVATGWNVFTSVGLEDQKVRVWVNEVTPRDLLFILRGAGVYYQFDPELKLLSLMTIEEYTKGKYGQLVNAQFPIEHAEVLDMESILTALMSENGKMIVDPRTAQIIVWDTPANIEEMEKALDILDHPLEQEVYQLKYIDSESVLDSVENVLSEIGIAHADPRTNAIIVQDLPTRQTQIAEIIKVLDRSLEVRTWTLNYVEPDVMLDRLGILVPEEMGPVTVDEYTHQLTITATAERLEEIDDLIREWDIPRLQVNLEAYLVTMDTEAASSLGINWSYFDEVGGTNFGFSWGTGAPELNNPIENISSGLSIGSVPYRVPLLNWWTGEPVTDADGNALLDPEYKGNRIGAVINYLESRSKARVLARPRVAVIDGEEAVFKSTRDEPYQTGGYNTGTYDNNSSNSNYNRVIPLNVNFITVGIVLKVKPRVNEDGSIVMDVSAEVSDSEDKTVTVADQNSTIPSKIERSAETTVMVGNDQTVAIGGLLSTSARDNMTNQVPLLADIPLLGRLFKTPDRESSKQEFLIFITPTVIDQKTTAEAARVAETDETIAKAHRHDLKPWIKRVGDRLSRGENEIMVSIGQTGSLYSDGDYVTVEDLSNLLAGIEKPGRKTLVIRAHPRAPEAVVASVEAAAQAVGMPTEREEGFDAAVPPTVDMPAPLEMEPVTP